MGTLEDFGRSGISYGISLAMYGLLYVPVMRGWELEPWTPTQVGLTVLGCAVVIVGIVEWRRPSDQPSDRSGK